jgi:probable phosphoglycerate mutase
VSALYLVRHASTEWSNTDRYLSRTDIDLSVAGDKEARRLAEWAATLRIDAIVTSPSRRAVGTAAVVARRLGVEARRDERLRELDFGSAEGRTLAELRATDADAVARFESDPFAHPLPGGEKPADALGRVRSAIEDLLATSVSRPLVVTHNTLLRLFLCDALGLRPSDYRRRFPIAEHCAVTELSVSDGTVALLRFNAAP